MRRQLHITSGDISGEALRKSGIPGEVFVWHDILYDGPRAPGWPDETVLDARARFLEAATGGGLSHSLILETLRAQYQRLSRAAAEESIVLWFDACLFDQAMLTHILACLRLKGASSVELLCVDAFPGVVPYDGLGQLRPDQLASCYAGRQPITESQFLFSETVDAAFATQDRTQFAALAVCTDAPLPWVPAAAARWLQEWPDERTGLGRLERLALDAVLSGSRTPARIYATVSAQEAHPQFWGDTTLWAKINGLADRHPPLVRIEGPAPRLPQWNGQADLALFKVHAASAPAEAPEPSPT